jgi:hypothetical protein
MISFDRIFSTLFKTKYKFLSGKKYLWVCVLLILTILFASSFINLSFHLLAIPVSYNNSINFTHICIPSRELSFLISMSGFIIRVVIPFLLMLVFNCILIFKLFWQKRQTNRLSKREYIFAVTIIVMNNEFLLFNTPISVQQIYEYLTTATTEEQRAIISLTQKIAGFFLYSYYAFTFLFYLKFNIIFRRELFKSFQLRSNN